MRVAILCPGPSLGMWERCPQGPYGAVLGVNQAVELYRCDWWVFKDWWIFYKFEPKEIPTGICSLGPEIKDHFRETDPGTNDRLVPYEMDPKKVRWARSCVYRNIGDWEFNDWNGQHKGNGAHLWKRFTVGTAFMLAYQLGATEFHVYGADMEGERDFAGRGPRRSTDRDGARWELERATWDVLEGWLVKRGIPVRRIVK